MSSDSWTHTALDEAWERLELELPAGWWIVSGTRLQMDKTQRFSFEVKRISDGQVTSAKGPTEAHVIAHLLQKVRVLDKPLLN